MKISASIRMMPGDEIRGPHVVTSERHIWMSIEQANGSQTLDIFGDDAALWEQLAKTAANVARMIREEA